MLRPFRERTKKWWEGGDGFGPQWDNPSFNIRSAAHPAALEPDLRVCKRIPATNAMAQALGSSPRAAVEVGRRP